VRHAVVRFGALFAAAVVAGCYLYSPDVTLDADVKQQPREYICEPTAAHPAAAFKRQTVGWFTDTCSFPPGSIAPISLVPLDKPRDPLSSLRNDDQLTSAIAYAEYARDQYMAAKRQGGSIPPFLASVLAPIGGTALALGAIGISPTTVTSLGAAGGTVVGAASYLQSKDREKIYVTGSEGVQCLLNNMEPFTYIDRKKLYDLYKWLELLAYDRLVVNTLVAAVEAEPQPKECPDQADQRKAKDPKKEREDAAKNNRAKLLAAAQAASKAAATTDSIGNTFLRTAHDSPATIVYTVDKINNSVSESIISTEPDIATLAKNLQTTISTEEQNITASTQSVPNAKSSTKDAAAATPPAKKASAAGGEGAAKGAAAAEGGAPAAAPSPGSVEAAVHIASPPPDAPSTEFPQPYDPSDTTDFDTVDAQLSAALLNTAATAGIILDIVGDNTKPPKNDACPLLAKKAGEPKVLTFVPDGDIIVKKGSHSDLTVAGAQNPYIRPLFGQDQPTVTATLKENNVLEIAATGDAVSGHYPFFIGDGPTGKPVTAVILFSKDKCTQNPPKPNPHKSTAPTGAKLDDKPATSASTPNGSSGSGDGAGQPSAAPSPQASAEDDSQPANTFASKDNGSIDYSNPYGY
jgi:hypothetical protein